MTEFVGKNLYVKFGTTELQGDFRTFSPHEEVGLEDASAGADANRTYLATLKDGTAELELVAQEDGTVLWDALVPGTSGTLEWGEEGTTAGNAKHTVTAYVRSRDKEIPYAGVVILSVSFQFSGAISDTVYP